jgi:Tfp pilus assembly pilus retraction ATPase PilT
MIGFPRQPSTAGTLMNLSSLAPLTEEELTLVRDICVPITIREQADGGRTVEGSLDSAFCFVGEPTARRLFNPASDLSTKRLLKLFDAITRNVEAKIDRFRLELDGVSYRAQIGETTDGHDITLRALPDHVPSLADLRMSNAWRELINHPDLVSGGLLLFVATNGQGKTTSCAASVATRLETWSGVAFTCEDPPELPMSRTFGRGICVQRPVTTADPLNPGQGYAAALIKTLRQFPAITGGGTILMVGEIRDAETAAETVKAASNGHLVVATMHARSVQDAVRRLVNYAAAGNKGAYDVEGTREAIAGCLAGIFHQRLKWDRTGTGWQAAEVSGELLWAGKYDSPAAKAIAEGNLSEVNKISTSQTQALRALSPNAAADEVMRAIGC